MASRLLSRVLFSTLGHHPLFAAASTSRGVVNGAMDYFLFREFDLPPADPDYLTVMPEEKRFVEKYGDGKWFKIHHPEAEILRRLAIVLPLKIAGDKVIPIPYIVDTGAPGLIYLGTKPLDILNGMNLLTHVMHDDEVKYLVNGVLTFGKKEVTQVFASDVPPPRESIYIRGDIRCNLLGLEGIERLGLLEIRGDLKVVNDIGPG